MATMAEIMGFIENNSVALVMLAILTRYILQKAKNDDRRVSEAQQAAISTTKAVYDDAQEKIEAVNRASREREDILLNSSMAREEMLRKESEKREELIRKESEKRESILLLNMDRITASMGDITRALDEIKKSFSGIDRRLEKIEERVGTAYEQA